LADILAQDDYWLEASHDYIQWLFPTKEKSRVTPGAPTITSEIEREFKKDSILQDHLKASFARILHFYGLEIKNNKITKYENWTKNKKNWFIENTHNNLRITRIIKSLNTLGLKNEAKLFYNALMQLSDNEPDCGIDSVAISYWTDAINE